MKEIIFKPFKKQHELFEAFNDIHTTELLYGGSVGAGKTYIISALMTIKCLEYPGIRIGLCRNELTTLKKTTVVTLTSEVFPDFGLNVNEHYKYNSIEGKITFFNGSEIILQELRHIPSDDNYTRLGGLLLTFAVIDEAGETNEKGKQILQSRIGRWKNELYGIKPILLLTCNPSRNFLYDDFYIADKENKMPKWRKFIKAGPYDNPHLPTSYIDNLRRTLSPSEVERLLNGNWEYSDNPNNLITLDDFNEMYDDSIPYDNKDITRRLSVDIAFKQDSCVIMVWEGLSVIDIIKVEQGVNVLDTIKNIATKYNIQTRNITYDSDGVGQYLSQYLRTAKGIINNGQPYKKENYKNLKTQLYYKLGELIREGKIKIKTEKYRKELEAELLCVQRKERETTESKMEINSKAEMKQILGKSPDLADTMAYGMVFQYISTNGIRVA